MNGFGIILATAKLEKEPDKCTECKGFHDEPQCAAVCPVDCCVPDDAHVETEEQLLAKQRFMHPED